MKFVAAKIGELASSTKFSAENLEKVFRLRALLIEFHKHSFLRGKLVLKGGTALNLFYLNLARRSVDIDLNYIGHIDREATQLGHSDLATTLNLYAHGVPDSQRRAMERVSEALFSSVLKLDDGAKGRIN